MLFYFLNLDFNFFLICIFNFSYCYIYIYVCVCVCVCVILYFLFFSFSVLLQEIPWILRWLKTLDTQSQCCIEKVVQAFKVDSYFISISFRNSILIFVLLLIINIGFLGRFSFYFIGFYFLFFIIRQLHQAISWVSQNALINILFIYL